MTDATPPIPSYFTSKGAAGQSTVPPVQTTEKDEYHCDSCLLSYATPGGLVRHHKVAHEGLRFVCKVCGKTQKRKKWLSKHVIEVHGIDKENWEGAVSTTHLPVSASSSSVQPALSTKASTSVLVLPTPSVPAALLAPPAPPAPIKRKLFGTSRWSPELKKTKDENRALVETRQQPVLPDVSEPQPSTKKAEMLVKEVHLSERKLKLETHEKEVADREREVVNRERRVAEKERTLANQERGVALREKEVVSKRNENKEKSRKTESRETKVQEREKEMGKRLQTLQEREARHVAKVIEANGKERAVREEREDLEKEWTRLEASKEKEVAKQKAFHERWQKADATRKQTALLQRQLETYQPRDGHCRSTCRTTGTQTEMRVIRVTQHVATQTDLAPTPPLAASCIALSVPATTQTSPELLPEVLSVLVSDLALSPDTPAFPTSPKSTPPRQTVHPTCSRELFIDLTSDDEKEIVPKMSGPCAELDALDYEENHPTLDFDEDSDEDYEL